MALEVFPSTPSEPERPPVPVPTRSAPPPLAAPSPAPPLPAPVMQTPFQVEAFPFTRSAPAPDPDGARDLRLGDDQMAKLRQLRSVVQDLLSVLESVRTGGTTLDTYAQYVTRTRETIVVLAAECALARAQGDYTDSIQHLRNVCDQLASNPLLLDPSREFPPKEQLHHLNILKLQCDQLIYQVGVLTIPDRLGRWLARARPGYYVPFHAVFDDELPSQEDRVRVLRLLAWSPEAVPGGLVDASNGLIYKYSRSARWRALSVFIVVAAFAATVSLLYGAASLGAFWRNSGWPLAPADYPALLGAWLCLLTGVLVHMGVGTAKRQQSQVGFPPVLSLGDLPRVVNAKVGQILLKIFLTLFGVLALVFTGGVAEATPMQAFLIGYSLDSVVELFSVSAEQRAAGQVSALKQQLGVAI
jgi:hypothetical protein